jgi:hypothetical protein
MLWTKFVTVSAFSGATSLMRADVGRIFSDAHARIFLEQLRDEGMAVASAAGRPMPDGYKEFVISFWRKLPPETRSSMANDLARNKQIDCHGCPGACTCSAPNWACRRLGTRPFIVHCIFIPMAPSLRKPVPADRKLSRRQGR